MFSNVSKNIISFSFALICFLLITTMDAIIKQSGSTIHGSIVVILLALGSAFWLSMFKSLKIIKDKKLNKSSLKSLLLFSLFSGYSQAAAYYAITHAPMEDFYSIAAMEPFLLTLCVSIWMNKKIPKKIYGILFMGIIGTFLIVDPSFSTINKAHLSALSVVFAGFLRDAILNTSDEELPKFWSLIGSLISTLMFSFAINGIPLIVDFQLNTYTFLVSGIIGLLFSTAMIFHMKALSIGEVQFPAFARYSQIILGMLFSAFLFKTPITKFDLTGALLIIIAGIILLRENKKINM